MIGQCKPIPVACPDRCLGRAPMTAHGARDISQEDEERARMYSDAQLL